MGRFTETIRDDLIALLPSGWALGARGGIIDVLLTALAAGMADAEEDAAALIPEMDPRTAYRLLPDFERVLGPDPCGRDLSGLTLGDRRRLAHQRWTSLGGASRAYFIGLAAKLGYAITIEEFRPSRSGTLRAGQRLRPEGCQFVWRVRIGKLVSVTKFRAGASTAGHSLGAFKISDLECVIRRLAPAHTTVIFAYGAA